MGNITLKYRLAGLVYLLTMFFFLPFSLIYLNQDSFQTLNLVYEQPDTANNKSQYRIVVKTNLRTQSGRGQDMKRYRILDPMQMPYLPLFTRINEKQHFIHWQGNVFV
jgi:hypothetical protein